MRKLVMALVVAAAALALQGCCTSGVVDHVMDGSWERVPQYYPVDMHPPYPDSRTMWGRSMEHCR